MELDLNLRVTVPERVMELAERYVAVLERMHPAPAAAPLAPVAAPPDSARQPDPLAPIEETMVPMPVGAEAPPDAAARPKSKWSDERREAQRARMRKRFEDPAYKADMTRRRWAGSRPPSESAASPPAAIPAPPPPALDIPIAVGPIAVPLENVIRWAGERGIQARTWDDLPAVNAKRRGLGLPEFTRPARAA